MSAPDSEPGGGAPEPERVVPDLVAELGAAVGRARAAYRDRLAAELEIPVEVLKSSHDDGCECFGG